jgi:type I restriction enzyme R subunit
VLDDAVEALILNDLTKKQYLAQANTIWRLYKAILPDREAMMFAPRCLLFNVLAKKIQSLIAPADIEQVIGQVEELLDESIDAEGYVIRERAATYDQDHRVNLAQIDFQALKDRFHKGKKRTEGEKLRGQVNSKLQRMVRLNRTRMDYLEHFQKMIDEYNAGSLNIDEFFQRLMTFAQSLNEEEKRGVAEQLSEEELALFDILTKPHMELSEKEVKQVKKVARDLLATLNSEYTQ